MKVSKKLLSLLLVVMLLLSAVPFQAFAAELITPAGYTVKINAVVDGENKGTFTESAASEAEANAWLEAIKADPAGALDEYGVAVPSGATVTATGALSGTTMNITITATSPAAPAPTTTNLTLTVYDSADNAVESKGPVAVSNSDLETWKAEGVAKAGAILSAFGSKFTASDVKSVAFMGTSVVVVLNGTPTGGVGGDVAAKYTITVNTGSGSYTVSAYEGQLYSAVLSGKEPARPGQNFLGWKSDSHGTVTGTTVVTGDDTVTALWSDAIKYSITFIDERGTTPTVVKIKQVAYGSAIGALPVPAERDGYVFAGWKLDAANNKIISAETVYNFQGDSTAYATWKLESDVEDEPMNGGHEANGKVYLMIFVNGKTGDSDLVKKIDVTKYAADNKITRTEMEPIAKKYVSAKAGYSLAFEGLFDDGLWWEYKHDPETDGKASIVVNMDDGDDYVYVMVKNVKTVAADSTNPKTGDAIFAAIGAMASSAATAAYLFLNKKRIVK